MNILEPIIRCTLANPEAPAIIAGQQSLSYGAVARHIAAISSRLAEQGVLRGDVVGIVADGFVDHVLTTLAIARLGATSVSFSHMRPEQMARFASECGARTVVHNDVDGPRVEASGVANRISLQELTSRPPRAIVPMVRSEPDELFRIALSSGTTGRQKAVKFSHESMMVRSHLTRTVFPSTPGERVMVMLPVGLHFSLGYILRTLMCGGTLVDRGETAEATAAAIRSQKVTLLLASPGSAVDLVRLAQTDPSYAKPSSDLRALCIGGARVAPTLQALLRQHVCPSLYINYGMTEAGGLVAQADTALLESHPAAAGRLMPWVEVEAVDDAGNPLPFGSEGRLRVRSPCLASGYIAVDPETTDAFRDGWFYSGDVGLVTGDGLVFLGSRADVLNLGGTKVSAEAIEAVVAQDPAILECAALTLPDSLQQQQLVILVVSPNGFDTDALRQRCVSRFGPNFTPRTVIGVQDLPHNAAGKIQRRELPAFLARQVARAGAPGTTPAV
jgi:acyl-CoA synthetase (AMP-forming)/AMP-acid ligase II